MMGIKDVHDLISSLFIMLNKKSLILFRIEFLVVLATVLFLAMFFMDIFRRYYMHYPAMKAIFGLSDAVSDSIVIYLLGAMQTTPFKNQLFPVWGLVLVILRYSVDFISGYGVPDPSGRRFTEWRNVVKLLGSGFLNWTRGSRFARPLWSLWALQIMRSFYRFWCRNLAFSSNCHGQSSEIISEYMRANCFGKRNFINGCQLHEDHISASTQLAYANHDCPEPQNNPMMMEGYTYLVFGEQIELKKPEYALIVRVSSERIWNCPIVLEDKEINDLCVAFALSRLLRCRMEGVELQTSIHDINLVKSISIGTGDARTARRASKIMETQLAFVNDYFNTRFPMVFWSGLPSLCISLLLSLVTIGVVIWLSVDIRKVYMPPKQELAHMVKGVNVDMIITWVFMSLVMFKEIWEMIVYLLSDWTRLLLVCMYARWKRERSRDACLEKLIKCLFAHRITAKRWHGLLDQYVFVQSYDYIPKYWNRIHKVTTGVVPKRENGAKPGDTIKISDCVISEIWNKLYAILEESTNFDGTVNKDAHCLSKVITTLMSDERKAAYGWACFHQHTSSQVILVWHIATNFCELALAEKNDDSWKPGFLYSILGCIRNCYSSNQYGYNLRKELKEKFRIANNLSSYCGYLLVEKPELIPDSFLVPKMVFQRTVKIARDDILKHCDSLESRYTKLCLEAYRAKEDSENVKKGDNVVKQGALLGKLLLDNEGVEGCWEILAGVWAELLIHIAPSWNAEAHKKCLESGGEFVTNIWALLWHCSIEKSRLWTADDRSEDNCPADPQVDDVGGNNSISTAEEILQAGTDPKNNQITNVVHEEDEIVEAEGPRQATYKD